MSPKKPKSLLKLKKRPIEAFGGLGDERRGSKKRKKKKNEEPAEERVELVAAPPPPSPQAPDDSPEPFGDIYAALDAASEADDIEADGLPSPRELMRLAISADLDPSIFTERSFPVAANIIEWCRDANFLGFSGELRPRQFQVLAQFFADVCYLCSDTHYVHTVPVDDSLGNMLDRFVLLEHGICPKCRRNRTEMLSDWIRDPRFADYNSYEDGTPIRPVPPNELVGVWGQRSGKSYTVATFAAPYVLHRYLALPNPTRYFEQASNSILQASFVAPTIYQAEDNLWKSFRQIYENSPWFRAVKKHNIEEGKRLGVSLYEAAKRFIFYPGKRIAIYMQAASSITLRGATRIFAAMDEMGWFNTNQDGKRRTGVKDGTEVFNALENSLQTIRTQANRRRRDQGDYNTLDAYMFNISSPTSISDPIMQRAAVANKSPRMFYTHYATWEANPDEDEETIKEQKRGDPESLMRDFYAIPPRALSPFFPNYDLVKQLVSSTEGEVEPLFTYSIEKEHRTDSLALLRPVLKSMQPDIYSARVLAIDNGEVNDSFALCVAKYDPPTDTVIYEEFLEVAPYKGFHVDLLWCYNELIVPLMRTFQFVHVVFDRWNSAMQVLDLRDTYGQDAAQRYTLKWKDFEDFKHDLQDMKAHFPKPEIDPDELIKMRTVAMRSAYPRAHFQLQLTTVEQFGRKLYKPDGGTDDLFRVAALCHSQIRRNQDIYVKRSYGHGRRLPGIQTAGVFRGASSRGMSAVGSIYNGGEFAGTRSSERSVGISHNRSMRLFRGR